MDDNYSKMLSFLASDKFKELIRFGIVGVLATVVHYGIYLLLLHIMNESIAYSIGYIVSFIGNFLASNYFTFKTKPTAKKGVGFVLSHFINYLLHIILLNVFIYIGVHSEWAPVPVFLLVIPVNFLLVRTALKKLN